MSCRRILPLFDAFADGELAPDQVLAVEQHIIDCARCAEQIRLDHALRTSTRRAVLAEVDVSSAFKARISDALAAERAREASQAAPPPMTPLSWRSIAPLALAASMALYFAASRTKSDDTTVAGANYSQASLAGGAGSVTASVEQLIDQLVTHHMRAEKPSVTEPNLLQRFEPEVGVPVRAPSLYGARWEGASVVPVNAASAANNQRAASLRYNLGGRRVTLYVYNSARVPLRATLEPRVVYNTPVYVGSRRGYSIAAVERRGVGYAVATDLNDRESAELVVASLH